MYNLFWTVKLIIIGDEIHVGPWKLWKGDYESTMGIHFTDTGSNSCHGYFSQDFEQASEEDAFTPDDDVSRANQKVRDEFGSQRGQLTVLIKAEDNVLSRGSLLAQLDWNQDPGFGSIRI